MTTGAIFAVLAFIFGSILYTRIKRNFNLFIGLLLALATSVVVGTIVVNSRNSEESTTEVSITTNDIDEATESVTQTMFPSETRNTALTPSATVTKRFQSVYFINTKYPQRGLSRVVRINSPPYHNTS